MSRGAHWRGGGGGGAVRYHNKNTWAHVLPFHFPKASLHLSILFSSFVSRIELSLSFLVSPLFFPVSFLFSPRPPLNESDKGHFRGASSCMESRPVQFG